MVKFQDRNLLKILRHIALRLVSDVHRHYILHCLHGDRPWVAWFSGLGDYLDEYRKILVLNEVLGKIHSDCIIDTWRGLKYRLQAKLVGLAIYPLLFVDRTNSKRPFLPSWSELRRDEDWPRR